MATGDDPSEIQLLQEEQDNNLIESGSENDISADYKQTDTGNNLSVNSTNENFNEPETLNVNVNGDQNHHDDQAQDQPTNPNPSNEFCRFYRAFIAPSNNVILTTFDHDENIIDNPENLYDDLPSGTRLEYTCRELGMHYKGVNSTVCKNDGNWSETPHNNKFRKYCVDPEKETLRKQIAYYIAFVSIIIIVSVSVFFLTNCLVKRVKVKKKIRAEQLARQQRQMHENQAYLENTSRFQLVA